MAATQAEKAERFAALHDGGVLVLPNAWDAGSAAVIAAAGAPAIATTSGGVSWSTGRPDGQAMTREQMVEEVGRIVAAVELPVSADVEGGYGPAPEDVAATVEAVVGVGAVGVNIEDSGAPGGGLFGIEEQAARFKAASEAAARAGLPNLTINARTDVYLFEIGAEEDRLAEVIGRAEAYAEAGATSLFVPGLLDLEVLGEIVRSVGLPVNAMVGRGAPRVADLAKVGVRRVSLGTAVAQAAYATARRVTAEVLEDGTFSSLEDSFDFGEINSLFHR